MSAIGDSLAQGFMSGAISSTTTSFPALIANSLSLQIPRDFRVPHFPGSGLPLNIEELLHFIGSELGSDLRGKRTWLWRFPKKFSEFADRVEDLYERGAGNQRASFGGTYHNLSVWGFRVHDSFTITPQRCQEVIDDDEGFIQDDFLGLPSAPMYRTAWRVLNPRRLSFRNQFTHDLRNRRLLAQPRKRRVRILEKARVKRSEFQSVNLRVRSLRVVSD